MRLAALLLAAAPALADAPAVESLATPEGREMLHVEMPGAGYSQLSLFWPGTAALGAPGREGLFVLGARLPFERAGGRGFDEIDEALLDAGEAVFLVNRLHGTILVLQAAEGPFEASVEIARDVLGDAALAEDDLDYLKRGIEDGLAQSERDAGLMAERASGALVAGGDRRLSALTNRPFETVAAVELAEIRAWAEETFHDAPLIVSAGPLDAETAGAAADAVLDGLPEPSGEPGTPEPVTFAGAGTTVAIPAPEIDVAVVTMPFLLPSYSAAGGVAFAALGGPDGRLFRRVREEMGASYGLGVNVTPLTPDRQLVALAGAVEPSRAGEVVAIMREEVARLREEGPTQAEIDAALAEQLASFEAAFTDPDQATGYLLDRLALGLVPDLDAVAEPSRTLTLEEAAAAIPDLLVEDPPAVIVTPDPDAAEADCVLDVPEEAADCAG